jgi:hypothetical protein
MRLDTSMMALGDAQRTFSLMVSKLITKAYDMGYQVTLGDAYRDPRVFGAQGLRQGYGEPNSAHKLRLAIDLNLFKDKTFLTSSSDHEPLGLWWESIGGTWGGRFRSPDGNHYSLYYAGVA